MTDDNRVTYTCPQCGYTNTWTRDQILQRGEMVLYRGDDEDIYSLKCKNPSLSCSQRMKVALKRKGA